MVVKDGMMDRDGGVEIRGYPVACLAIVTIIPVLLYYRS